MVKRIKNIDYMMLLSVLLIISILFNVYAFFKLSNYKYKIGEQSYTNIEDFKQRNESNMNILSKGLEEKNIKNEDLLKLYKNYDAMCNDIIELWQQYGSYSQNAIPLLSKKIKTNKVMENEIHGKIKEYVLSKLNKQMINDKSKLELDNDELQSFESMYEISTRLNEYFNKFNEETLKGITGEDKEKIVINKYYWIDMLEGIYDISDDYVNLQWKTEAIDTSLKQNK
ncbi:hypothetical protein [Clostridium sp.]|uniref:hypothetical protein n=1 Tax=Clostridium sp. TaxID=1506 RepID=UPI0026251A1D|nr:hypothetical protein [Clostridium sp.]